MNFKPGSQLEKLYEALQTAHTQNSWRTLSELETLTGISTATLSAQLRNLRKASFGGHKISKRQRTVSDHRGVLWEYLLLEPTAKALDATTSRG